MIAPAWRRSVEGRMRSQCRRAVPSAFAGDIVPSRLCFAACVGLRISRGARLSTRYSCASAPPGAWSWQGRTSGAVNWLEAATERDGTARMVARRPYGATRAPPFAVSPFSVALAPPTACRFLLCSSQSARRIEPYPRRLVMLVGCVFTLPPSRGCPVSWHPEVSLLGVSDNERRRHHLRPARIAERQVRLSPRSPRPRGIAAVSRIAASKVPARAVLGASSCVVSHRQTPSEHATPSRAHHDRLLSAFGASASGHLSYQGARSGAALACRRCGPTRSVP